MEPTQFYVTGNEDHLYRLISNLVINAVQYTPTDGQVNVILESSSHYVLIQIQDTGFGIATERTQIFEASIE